MALPTYIIINPLSCQTGVNATITAILTSNGLPVADKEIVFSVNGQEIETATTNETGTASITYNNLLTFGTYSLSAIFGGDSNYEESKNNTSFNVPGLVTPYLTPKQLRERAIPKNIDLTIYSDDMLKGKIAQMQYQIEESTNRIFAMKQVTEWIPRFDGTGFNLRWFPVLPQSLTINSGSEGPLLNSFTMDGQVVTWYLTQPEYGIVIFDMPIFNWGPYRVNNIELNYTVVYDLNDPTGVHPTAQALCADMALQSVKDARSQGASDMSKFDDRIRRLSRPLLTVVGR